MVCDPSKSKAFARLFLRECMDMAYEWGRCRERSEDDVKLAINTLAQTRAELHKKEQEIKELNATLGNASAELKWAQEKNDVLTMNQKTSEERVFGLTRQIEQLKASYEELRERFVIMKNRNKSRPRSNNTK